MYTEPFYLYFILTIKKKIKKKLVFFPDGNEPCDCSKGKKNDKSQGESVFHIPWRCCIAVLFGNTPVRSEIRVVRIEGLDLVKDRYGFIISFHSCKGIAFVEPCFSV